MNKSIDIKGQVLLVSFVLSMAGCLPAANPDATFLLGQDYLRMTDTQLVVYEQELSDELVRSSRSGNGDVSVGLGVGTWSGNTGFGVHADKWLGGGGGSSHILELKDRREEVRTEMRRRGLLPQ
jgi:hypothetical protein